MATDAFGDVDLPAKLNLFHRLFRRRSRGQKGLVNRWGDFIDCRSRANQSGHQHPGDEKNGPRPHRSPLSKIEPEENPHLEIRLGADVRDLRERRGGDPPVFRAVRDIWSHVNGVISPGRPTLVLDFV